MIGIIDYMAGNAASLLSALNKVDVEAAIIRDKHDLSNCNKIILPGVGSFDKAMQMLVQQGLLQVLCEQVLVEHIPFLGICLGMQLLGQQSEEGTKAGLGWINAKTKKLPANADIKVPHIGWNYVQTQKESKLFDGIDKDSEFYFAHSFYIECSEQQCIACTTNYSLVFTSAIEKGNIAGVQFHPEKSHKKGLQLLKTFAENF